MLMLLHPTRLPAVSQASHKKKKPPHVGGGPGRAVLKTAAHGMLFLVGSSSLADLQIFVLGRHRSRLSYRAFTSRACRRGRSTCHGWLGPEMPFRGVPWTSTSPPRPWPWLGLDVALGFFPPTSCPVVGAASALAFAASSFAFPLAFALSLAANLASSTCGPRAPGSLARAVEGAEADLEHAGIIRRLRSFILGPMSLKSLARMASSWMSLAMMAPLWTESSLRA
jgi:hypothetical protein